MASFYTFLTFFLVLMAYHFPVALPYRQNTKISTISAAPALLPEAPLSDSPSLSPDISPLFPVPGGASLAPSESSLPTITASPSPPNPDALASSPEPDAMALPPMPVSTSEYQNKVTPLNSVTVLVFLACFMMQLSGV